MTYYHSGDDGDVLYALASLRHLGCVDLRLTSSNGMVRAPYNPEKSERLASLIRIQPYIRSCGFATEAERHEEADRVVIDRFRHETRGESILEWQANYLGLGAIDHDPWLTVPDIERVEPVVIHRSERYHNDNFPWWDVPKTFKDRIVMVGSEHEHKVFSDRFGYVPYYPTKDYLALARVIGGCELFIGNQSAPMAVALGLGTNLIQEVCPWTPNCRLRRANAQYLFHWEERALWELPEIVRAMRLVTDRTVITSDRLVTLALGVRNTSHLPGEMAEAGVYRGGSAKLISIMNPNKRLHLFDTFEGIPEDDAMEGGHKKGEFSSKYEDVRAFLADDPVEFHVGRFPNSASNLSRNVRFSFVHLDLDIYQSTADAIDFFWPRMVGGGIIAFDDYGWQNCPGVAVAIAEKLPGIHVHVGCQQAWVFKPETSDTSEQSL
jgi:hypothetical protein